MPGVPDDVLAHLSQGMRLAVMQMDEAAAPMREWLHGQVAYFQAQGFGPDDARAMAAAEFVMMFGTGIYRTPMDPDSAG